MQKRLLTNHDQAYLEECARCKVSYMEEQPLTEEQKLTARNNIGVQQNIDATLLAAKESGVFDGIGIVSIYVNAESRLHIKLSDGTELTSQSLKGEKGTPATIKRVAENDDGTAEYIVFSDNTVVYLPVGKSGYTPQKGVDYFDGTKGDPGHTPVKGVDYWSDEDRAEIVQAVLAAIPVGDEVAY